MEQAIAHAIVEAANSASSPSHSRDSAIDADMAEWEIETFEINTVGGLNFLFWFIFLFLKKNFFCPSDRMPARD